MNTPLECFVCGSKSLYRCEEFDSSNTSFIETCPDNTKSCLKSLGTFNNVTGNLNFTSCFGFAFIQNCIETRSIPISVVRRQCSKDQAINQCTSNSMKGASVTFCSCEETLCNQQESPIRASLLLLMTSLLSTSQPWKLKNILFLFVLFFFYFLTFWYGKASGFNFEASNIHVQRVEKALKTEESYE